MVRRVLNNLYSLKTFDTHAVFKPNPIIANPFDFFEGLIHLSKKG